MRNHELQGIGMALTDTREATGATPESALKLSQKIGIG
jgi:hypothetical protein